MHRLILMLDFLRFLIFLSSEKSYVASHDNNNLHTGMARKLFENTLSFIEDNLLQICHNYS